MANEIGPLAVKAVVNPKGVDEGLDAAKGKFKAGASKLAEEAGKAGDEAGKSWGARFASAAKWGLAGVAGAGLLGGASLAAAYAQGAGLIRDIGNAAKAASVPMAEFQSVAFAFGKNEDALDGLVKLNTAMGKAAVLGENVGAFTSLGLDPAKLLAGGNAFEQVADRIAGLGSGFQQAWAAQQLFGEEYKKFLPVLAQGGQFIREQRDLLAGFGATASEGTLSAVKAADRLFHQFSALKEGLFVQVAEGLAPLLAALAEKLPKLHEVGVTFKGLGESLRHFVEGVAKFGVGVFEAFRSPAVRGELFGLMDRLMKYAGEKFSEYLLLGVGKVFQAVGKVNIGLGLGFDLGATGERLLAQSRHAGSQAGGQLGMAGVRWSQLMDVVGQTAGGRWLDDLFGRAQTHVQQIGVAAKANDPFAIWEESARGFAGKLDDGGPLTQFAREVGRVKALMNPPLAMRNWPADPMDPTALDPFNAKFNNAGFLAIGQQMQKLRSQFGAGGSMLSGALLQGTAGASSAINAGRFSAADDLADLLKEANRQREALIKLGQDAARDPALDVFLRGR